MTTTAEPYTEGTRIHHDTVDMEIGGETVEIDRMAVPLVSWLNSLPSVVTLHSCQGDDRSPPYASFRCGDRSDLVAILEPLTRHLDPGSAGPIKALLGHCHAEYRDGEVRFSIYFASEVAMAAFVAVVTDPSRAGPDSCSDSTPG